MNKNLLSEICQKYDFGKPTEEPYPVSGGLIHKIWHIRTNKGQFVVKVLDSEIMKRPNIVESFELSEKIARELKDKGIAAITGLIIEGKAVQNLSEYHVIVYEWIEGLTLPTSAAQPAQAFLIGKIIGEIHRINLKESHLQSEGLNIFSDHHWGSLITTYKESFPKEEFNFDVIQQWNKNAKTISEKMASNVVVSHGDIDQKNVIWKDDQAPFIIDWEGASETNAGLEIMDAALNWSGLVSGTIVEESMKALIDGYKSTGMAIKESTSDLLEACILKWLNWLEFNMQRAVKSPKNSDEQKLSVSQVKNTLRNIDLISSCRSNK